MPGTNDKRSGQGNSSRTQSSSPASFHSAKSSRVERKKIKDDSAAISLPRRLSLELGKNNSYNPSGCYTGQRQSCDQVCLNGAVVPAGLPINSRYREELVIKNAYCGPRDPCPLPCRTCNVFPCRCSPLNSCPVCRVNPCCCRRESSCIICRANPCCCKPPPPSCVSCRRNPCCCTRPQCCVECRTDPCCCPRIQCCVECRTQPCCCPRKQCTFRVNTVACNTRNCANCRNYPCSCIACRWCNAFPCVCEKRCGTCRAYPCCCASEQMCCVCRVDPCCCILCKTCRCYPCRCSTSCYKPYRPTENCQQCRQQPCTCRNCFFCHQSPCVCKYCRLCERIPCRCKRCKVCWRAPCVCTTCTTCSYNPCVCTTCITCKCFPCKCNNCRSCMQDPCCCSSTRYRCSICHACPCICGCCRYCDKNPCCCPTNPQNRQCPREVGWRCRVCYTDPCCCHSYMAKTRNPNPDNGCCSRTSCEPCGCSQKQEVNVKCQSCNKFVCICGMCRSCECNPCCCEECPCCHKTPCVCTKKCKNCKRFNCICCNGVKPQESSCCQCQQESDSDDEECCQCTDSDPCESDDDDNCCDQCENCEQCSCDNEPGRMYQTAAKDIQTDDQFTPHQCPWEADIKVSGVVRGHCTSTTDEIARNLSGRFKAYGERLTNDSEGLKCKTSCPFLKKADGNGKRVCSFEEESHLKGNEETTTRDDIIFSEDIECKKSQPEIIKDALFEKLRNLSKSYMSQTFSSEKPLEKTVRRNNRSSPPKKNGSRVGRNKSHNKITENDPEVDELNEPILSTTSKDARNRKMIDLQLKKSNSRDHGCHKSQNCSRTNNVAHPSQIRRPKSLEDIEEKPVSRSSSFTLNTGRRNNYLDERPCSLDRRYEKFNDYKPRPYSYIKDYCNPPAPRSQTAWDSGNGPYRSYLYKNPISNYTNNKLEDTKSQTKTNQPILSSMEDQSTKTRKLIAKSKKTLSKSREHLSKSNSFESNCRKSSCKDSSKPIDKSSRFIENSLKNRHKCVNLKKKSREMELNAKVTEDVMERSQEQVKKSQEIISASQKTLLQTNCLLSKSPITFRSPKEIQPIVLDAFSPLNTNMQSYSLPKSKNLNGNKEILSFTSKNLFTKSNNVLSKSRELTSKTREIMSDDVFYSCGGETPTNLSQNSFSIFSDAKSK